MRPEKLSLATEVTTSLTRDEAALVALSDVVTEPSLHVVVVRTKVVIVRVNGVVTLVVVSLAIVCFVVFSLAT